jgi:predicted GIY-YIG superfamily endonuclease
VAKDNIKRYVYIAQASKETTVCKIGITDDLKRRLKEYNSMTGKSKSNPYQYLFTCKTKNGQQVEKDITKKYGHLREKGSREMYLWNDNLFEDYVAYIKSHKMFVK